MRIAIHLFDGAEELDRAGRWEVLACLASTSDRELEVVTVADDLAPIVCAKGLRVLPDTTCDDLGEIDVLSYPGGRVTRGHLVARLASPDEARAVRRGIQYDPQPPV